MATATKAMQGKSTACFFCQARENRDRGLLPEEGEEDYEDEEEDEDEDEYLRRGCLVSRRSVCSRLPLNSVTEEGVGHPLKLLTQV